MLPYVVMLMIVYLVVSEADRPDLGTQIEIQFPLNSRKVAPAQWLVAANATAQSVAETIGLGGGRYGRCMVVGINGYYGWHEKDIWDWIALKEGQ